MPGREQVYRRYDGQGRMLGDTFSLESDPQPGETLLQPFMITGERRSPATPLAQLREYCSEQLARLPDSLRSLDKAPDYPVMIAPSLRRLAEEVDARLGIG